MLPIYICEDDALILAAQREFLEKQIMIEGYDMEIALCSKHPQEIIEAVAASPKRSLVWEMTGIFWWILTMKMRRSV